MPNPLPAMALRLVAGIAANQAKKALVKKLTSKKRPKKRRR